MSCIAIEGFSPPPGPPPLLSQDQLVLLAQQGFLSLPLSESFTCDIQNLFRHMTILYDQPAESKKRLYPEKLGTEFGYYHVEGEKEYITLRCSSASGGDAELEDLATKVWNQAGLLMHRILCDIARTTDLPCSIWDQITDGTLTMPDGEEDMTYTLFRMFKYFSGKGLAEKHTDLGLLTLCVGTRPGLQCLSRDEEDPSWVDAAGPVVLVGQTLRALSNGLIRPGIHRVVPSPEERYSIVYTLRHSSKHQIDLERFGGEGSLDPKSLWAELKGGVVNINARKELREQQRKKLDEKRKARVVGHG